LSEQLIVPRNELLAKKLSDRVIVCSRKQSDQVFGVVDLSGVVGLALYAFEKALAALAPVEPIPQEAQV